MTAPGDDFETTYLEGRRLWGDDFDSPAIEAWFEAESTAYAQLYEAPAHTIDDYQYHRLNQRHGFRFLPADRFERALGLGSAFGAEFLPLVQRGRIGHISIVEPSEELRSEAIGSVVPEYIQPRPDGVLPFEDETFDLAVALGVLHHIPNVSMLVGEVLRTLKPGGMLVLSEPVISMGDWRSPRRGLTKNERGIPKAMLLEMVQACGGDVRSVRFCQFPTTGKLDALEPRLGFASQAGILLDEILCRAFAWNYRYHARTRLQKLRPSSVFIVAQKRPDA